MLYCHPEADPAAAFRSLTERFRITLDGRGQALSVRCHGESDQVDNVGSMLELGIDGLSSRIANAVPFPLGPRLDTTLSMWTNQPALVVRRGAFVVLYAPISDEVLRE